MRWGTRPLPGGPSDVLLAVTDGCSRTWWTGDVFRRLGRWSQHVPVALVMLLPEAMWSRTALRRCERVPLFRAAGGGPVYATVAEGGGAPGPVIPVVSIDPTSFAKAALLLGSNYVQVDGGGVVVPADAGAGPPPSAGDGEDSPSADERVHRFMSSASLEAIRLARLTALFPAPTFKTLRLVRAAAGLSGDALLDAEIVLGGLMSAHPRNPGPDTARGASGAGAGDWVYRFHPGVREALWPEIRPAPRKRSRSSNGSASMWSAAPTRRPAWPRPSW